jgi:hypothetical protein
MKDLIHPLFGISGGKGSEGQKQDNDLPSYDPTVSEMIGIVFFCCHSLVNNEWCSYVQYVSSQLWL